MNDVTFILLILCLSLDTLSTSFAYQIDGIRIPFKSILILALINSSVLVISIFLTTLITNFIDNSITNIISFTVIFTIGILKLLDYKIKKLITTNNTIKKFKYKNFNFILEVIAENKNADFDKSKILSTKEAISLAIVLSLDSFFAGFACNFFNINYFYIFISCLLINLLMFIIGSLLAKIVIKKCDIDLSWLSGIILILIAISKLLPK